MIIDKTWRILTVGDGDLSFSASLLTHYQPASLTATVLDTSDVLLGKYAHNDYQTLLDQQCPVLCEFDVTNPNAWSKLAKHSFDLVIFQFPLIPAFKSHQEFQEKCKEVHINTLNRQLLRHFLINSFEHFLDPNGSRLCYITSKDVKPYKEWNIENALHRNTDIDYLGWHDFNIDAFPGYKVRNVDRDKHVKDTKGITYVWSDNSEHTIKSQLSEAIYQGEAYCELCATGPYNNAQDKLKHQSTKKHLNMINYEAMWQLILDRE
ncbi:class I SAM-dependent methyltransferase [Psychromonas sp. 14N.309.X.WAT.B.A12]|uniref:class I SAM-dependent methyltransferase n=1 Tax=unclassified Psychromonas TaxID=2614957 RepID=UPI0025B00AF8|nr:class I SAM-dependent methyltransferase [Psychromonas sp. 14N.309.X.WAT.B.A12]MDN2661871.1 class I SAM-dependent methyltransferase [Psychromonas sp. 14N.309.X.WAT.B.A12]